MICLRCISRAALRTPTNHAASLPAKASNFSIRGISTQVFNATQPLRSPQAASSTTSAQSSTSQLTLPPTLPHSKAPKAKEAPKSVSSVPAGMVLKGLNYFKNKPDPVALEDHEYPEWLWTLLDERKKGAADGQKDEVDPRLFSKSANARRLANKRIKKMAQLNPDPAVPKVPIHEQAIDLPAGEQAEQARHDLTHSMRGKRRRDIKEANFLKSMN